MLQKNKRPSVQEYIKSQKPENKWEFLLIAFKTREFWFIIAGIFFLLLVFMTFAFIIVYNNPSMVNVNIK